MLSSASALDCNKKMMAGVVWSAAVWHVDFLWQHFAKVLTPRSPNENQDDFSHLAAEFIYITLRNKINIWWYMRPQYCQQRRSLKFKMVVDESIPSLFQLHSIIVRIWTGKWFIELHVVKHMLLKVKWFKVKLLSYWALLFPRLYHSFHKQTRTFFFFLGLQQIYQVQFRLLILLSVAFVREYEFVFWVKMIVYYRN